MATAEESWRPIDPVAESLSPGELLVFPIKEQSPTTF